MSRMARAAIAVALAITFGAAPLVADWCAASCEASRATADATMPACHHADSSAVRIGHQPSPCGQGHHPVVVDATATTVGLLRAPILLTAVIVHVDATTIAAGALRVRAGAHVDPLPSGLPLALSTPLRI